MRAKGRHIPGLGRVTIYLLIAHIATGLALIAYFVTLVVVLWLESATHTLQFAWIFVLLWILLSLPSLVVFLRVGTMRRLLKYGDYVELVEANSYGWAIAALLFSGVIPGIFLLLVNSNLSDVTVDESPPPTHRYGF